MEQKQWLTVCPCCGGGGITSKYHTEEDLKRKGLRREVRKENRLLVICAKCQELYGWHEYL